MYILCLFIVAMIPAVIFFILWIVGKQEPRYCHTSGCGHEVPNHLDDKCAVCRLNVDGYGYSERQWKKRWAEKRGDLTATSSRIYCEEVKETKMNKPDLSTMNLADFWTILDKETKKFVSGTENDFPNREGAVARAKELAKQYPSRTFLVMGPSDEVSANIPVDVKEWKPDV